MSFGPTAEQIYGLGLHHEANKNGIQVIRVPGGWLYALWNWDKNTWHEPVFVKFDTEFL